MWRLHSSPPARWLLPLLLAGTGAVGADPASVACPADAAGAGAPGAVAAQAMAPPAATPVPAAPLGWGAGFERRQVLRPPSAPLGPQSPAAGGRPGGLGAGHGRGKGR